MVLFILGISAAPKHYVLLNKNVTLQELNVVEYAPIQKEQR
jgi:hypothetical protein